MAPTTHYLSQLPALASGESISGPARILDLHGRKGINPTSIHTSIKLGAHNLNGPRGTVALWFFALEDLTCRFLTSNMATRKMRVNGVQVLGTDEPTPWKTGGDGLHLRLPLSRPAGLPLWVVKVSLSAEPQPVTSST